MSTIVPVEYTVAVDLLNCLCAALQANTAADPTIPMPAVCCLRPGVDIPLDVSDTGVDSCCMGEAYVKIGGSVPSSKFPDPDDPSTIQPCQMQQFATSFEIGVIRCVNLDADCATRAEKVRLLLADRQAMLKAACCWGKQLQVTVKRGTRWFVGEYAPFGPEGGCIGASLQLVAATPGYSCC